jgi:hypothetical protein
MKRFLALLFSNKPSPQRMGLHAGAVGAFGLGKSVLSLLAGDWPFGPDAAYYLAMSLLLVAAGINLPRSTPRGWWLGWAAMISASLSGFAAHPPGIRPPGGLPPLFLGGFMLAAGGVFFSMLSHRDVYGPCFSSSSLPHPFFGASPALLIIAGAAVLVSTGGPGLTIGAFVLVVSLIGARSVFGPLRALLRGQREWHD